MINTQKGETMDNKESSVYRCESCNGIMEYDVETKQMKCPNCGNCVPILNHTSKIIEHKLTIDAKRTLRPSEKTSTTMECTGCGATLEIGKDDTTSVCPYCGSAYVLAQKQLDAIIPDGIIPFNLDMNAAKETFHKWVKRRWLAPGKLKTLYQGNPFQSLYLPYWTFDADADADYTAMGGRTRTEQYKDKEGNVQTRTHTDWYHTHGHVQEHFDDILEKAVNTENAAFLSQIEPYDMGRLVSYAPEYLSGCMSQCYNVDLEKASNSARDDMEQRLRSLASDDVLSRYDSVKDVRLHSRYRNESYKHILVPVYSTSYYYEGKLYQVAINGQTGNIHGAYPKSPVKIAAIIIAILLVLAAIFLGGGSDDSSYGRTTEYEQTTPESESTYYLSERNVNLWDYLETNLQM